MLAENIEQNTVKSHINTKIKPWDVSNLFSCFRGAPHGMWIFNIISILLRISFAAILGVAPSRSHRSE